jgi:hypothetical protein
VREIGRQVAEAAAPGGLAFEHDPQKPRLSPRPPDACRCGSRCPGAASSRRFCRPTELTRWPCSWPGQMARCGGRPCL